MTEEIEIIEVGKKGSQHEWGHWDLQPGSFLEFQLLKKGFDPAIASSVSRDHPEVETFGELLKLLEGDE